MIVKSLKVMSLQMIPLFLCLRKKVGIQSRTEFRFNRGKVDLGNWPNEILHFPISLFHRVSAAANCSCSNST